MIKRPALPEEVVYRDTGCDVHHACLSCPLPVCKYEEGQPRATLWAPVRARNEEIRALYATGTDAKALAAQYGLSLHTVWKITREGK